MQTQWFNTIVQAGEKMVNSLLEPRPEKHSLRQMALPDIIEQARREWQDAQDYYNSVTDQDLIDHAVYRIQAAEKRYMYLMKKARQEGVMHSPYTMV